MIPVSLAMIRADLAAEDQGEALGLWTGMSGVTAALGPLLGGWLVDAFSWRAIFFLNLPLAAVALWAAWRFLPSQVGRRPAGRLWTSPALPPQPWPSGD